MRDLPPDTKRIDMTGEKEEGRGNFLLRPRAAMYPMVQDTTGNPQKHKNFIIINVGKAEITAQLEYGTRKDKIGLITECTLQPGDEMALETGEGIYEVTTVKITNATKIRAAFQMEGGESVLPPSAGEHYSELLDKEESDYPSEEVPLDGKSRRIEIPSKNELLESTEKLTITDITDEETDKTTKN